MQTIELYVTCQCGVNAAQAFCMCSNDCYHQVACHAIQLNVGVCERPPLGAAERGGSPKRSGPSDKSSPPLPPLPALVAAPNITATSAGASGRTRGGGAPASAPELNLGGAGPWLTADATAVPLPPTHGTAPGPPWSPHGGGPGLSGGPPCLACLQAALLLDALGAGGGSASAAGAGAAASVLGLGLGSGGGAGGGASTSASRAHTGSAVPSVDETVM